MAIRRRPFYADGFSWAIGVCPYMPTGAVGIDTAVSKTSFSDYITQLRQKLLDDFVKTFLPKLLDDFEKTFLQRTNSSDPTACLEECRMTCVAALVLKAVPQHVNEHYEWRLTSGKLPIFKELENEALTPTFEDQSMTDGRTHSPHENSVRTTNDAKEATSKAPPDTRDSSRISLPLAGAAVDLPGSSLS
ncbi:uncharacterized protein LOC125533228 [Triticum urartu]|uniref:uncharacterized protein LOC125533228 n=1 Tax=Triticum urartu TaxID=4572 RepID=UPI002044BE8C|nr:uncharacterized protein LOC125533228 [Triticum urartu]